MRTENLAIVFVDIAGYTPRTSAQTREENIRLLKRFDGIVRPLVRVFNGRVIKTIGDAFLLTFRSPTDALLCSMAIHDRLVESNCEEDPSEHFTIRAAVNVGEVRIEGGDVFGEAVNIASRIEGQAGAGEIYFSESVLLSMTKSEVPHAEVGPTELKGISGTVRLYRVPKAVEAGYGQKQVGGTKGAAGNADLPFGGFSLARVRDKIGSGSIAPVMDHTQNVLSRLPDFVAYGSESATKGFAWWMSEVRRSRAVQYGTIIVVVLLILVLVWAIKPKPRKLNPLQQIERSLGF
jgi:adenylate cyclase